MISNGDQGSSSHAVSIHDKISEVETEAAASHVNNDHQYSFQYLFDGINKSKDNYKFSPIYVAPNSLRGLNPSSFTPRVVSIGPLHKGNTSLKSMEYKKATMLTKLLTIETFELCMTKVMGSIERVKRSYFGRDIECSDVELAKMMVMDACFILQFINNLLGSDNDFSENRLRSTNIALDLVMLENQIPYFVLHDIYILTVEILQPGSDLTTMLTKLLDLVNPFAKPLAVTTNIFKEPAPHHILGLLHKFYQPLNFKLPPITTVPIAYSAVELDRVRVNIKPNKDMDWPMAIEFFENSMFWHKPTLKMPVVRIDNFFEAVLRNLIAYEQYSPIENCVTSYAMALHMLVASPADISQLGKAHVVLVHLGSNEKASEMISSICKNVNLQDFYYIEPWKNIDQYCNKCWPRNFAALKRTYFNTPWKAMAVLAAIIVFFVTVIQFFRH